MDEEKPKATAPPTVVLPQTPQPAADPPSPPKTGYFSLAVVVAAEDLTSEKLLQNAPRVTVEGRQVPALGGIPLLRKIGQGGMAAVYFAIHPRLKSELAIKVMPFQLANDKDDSVGRFFREAQIAANIRSPHLILVSDVNEEAGLFYQVMEYVNGISAGVYVRQAVESGKRGLDEPAALEICMGTAEGLKAAHNEGVVHRDIKPDNILIPKSKDGDGLNLRAAKLADLGLARHEDSEQSVTRGHTTIGTPGFMAPEQALGSKNVVKQSDVFSLGATLYALLCGQPPFMGETHMETVIATIQHPHVRLLKLRPDVSGMTESLIERCLSKKAEERHADGGALAQALKACRAAYRAPTTTFPTVRAPASAQAKAPGSGARATPEPQAGGKPTPAPGSGARLQSTQQRATPAPAAPAPNPKSGFHARATVTPAPATPKPAGLTRALVNTPPPAPAPQLKARPPIPEVRRVPQMAYRNAELVEWIKSHVKKHVGAAQFIFEKPSTPLIHIDLLHVPPSAERNFHTVVTAGMSVKAMPVPAGKEHEAYTELLICLPPQWLVSENSIKDPESYWPFRWLMQLARLPYEEKVAVVKYNTMANGNPAKPFGNNTKLNCLWITEPTLFAPEFRELKVDVSRTIRFLTVMPIHNEERLLKRTAGAAALLGLFKTNNVSELFDLKRKSLC